MDVVLLLMQFSKLYSWRDVAKLVAI